MKIRIFEEHDRNNVIALWEECNLIRPWNDPNKDIDRKVQFQPTLFLVGEIDSQIIASAMAGYDGHRGSVFYLAVRPDRQNNGLGKKMMEYIELLLVELGCPKLNIAIRSTNLSVLAFYNHSSYISDDVMSVSKRLISDTK